MCLIAPCPTVATLSVLHTWHVQRTVATSLFVLFGRHGYVGQYVQAYSLALGAVSLRYVAGNGLSCDYVTMILHHYISPIKIV